MSQTPLDIALATARQDPSQQMEFFGGFLTTELFFPLVDTSSEGDGEIAAPEEGGAISPLLLEIDGAPVLPVFDTPERLGEWAEGNKLPYASMPGHAIVEMAVSQSPTVLVAFNVGQESFVQFGTDDVEGLHQAWKAMHEEIKVEPGTTIRMGEPENDYTSLKAALKVRMAELGEIDRAYIIIVEGLSENGYDICVVLDVNDPGAGSKLAADLGPVASQHGPPGESVVIAGGHPHMLEFARNEIQPFYERIAA